LGGAGGAGEHFDIVRYRRVMAVNIDGTMFRHPGRVAGDGQGRQGGRSS